MRGGRRPGIFESLRRSWRTVASRLLPRRVDFFYGPEYELDLPSVPHDPLRPPRILTYLSGEKLLARGAVHPPRPASIKTLQTVHGEAYLESLHDPDTLTRVLGLRLPEGVQERVLDLQRAMVGGTIGAARRAQETGRSTFNLGGGFHHAFADHGARFCVFNDVAAAIEVLRGESFRGRILVVDLDLHDGDGTRSLFAGDPTVHTFSIHNQTNPEGDAGAVEATTVELGSGVKDEGYLAAIGEHLPAVFERFRPGMIFYVAGADPAHGDEIGDWEITAGGMLERDRRVLSLARDGDRSLPTLPLVVVLAGGYGQRAWRYSARLAALLAGAEPVPEPPSTEEVTLTRYRHLRKLLSPAGLTSEEEGEADDSWGLSDEDLLPALGGLSRSRRLLGYYSKHGVELALERSGVLDRLRALGFRPWVDLDLDNPSGETVRIFAGHHRRELLAEVRICRDRRTIPGMELLRVEWMLLQNPRAHFTERRPRLPGQEHPGLSMLADAVAFLILACERLGLDGLTFVPSHYHLAAQSRKSLRFLHPEAEARFRALRDALGDRPLKQATHLIAEGRVRDEGTGEPFEWKPAPMVLALSDRLRERVYGGEYESAVEEALADLSLAVGR